MKKTVVVAFIFGMIFLNGTGVVFAKKGFSLGVDFPYNSIESDFDGKRGYVSTNGNETLLVPKIDSAFGFGVLFGFGYTPESALEINYQASTHRSTWQGLNFDVNYSVLNFNYKYSFQDFGETQPYLMLGLGLNTLTVKNGASMASPFQIGDAKYTGISFNFEGGIDHYFTPNISAGFGLAYHYVDFTQGAGISTSGKLPSGLNGSGFGMILSTAYHFQ